MKPDGAAKYEAKHDRHGLRLCDCENCNALAEFYLNDNRHQARCIEHGAAELRFDNANRLHRIPMWDLLKHDFPK